MADVFFSYTRVDRARIIPLVKHLETNGISVWWDNRLNTGEQFRERIEKELDLAKCVIVAWSATSVDSAWVVDEAEVGRKRSILLPVLLDAVEMPLGFREFQAANLVNWQGNPDDPELQKLVESVHALVGRGPDAKSNYSDESFPRRQSNNLIDRNRRKKWVIFFSAILLLALAALSFIFWPKSNSVIFVRGRVSTADENPIVNAQIEIYGTHQFTKSRNDGTYDLKLEEYKLGDEITLSVSRQDFSDKTVPLKINSRNITNQNIYLSPEPKVTP